LCSEKNTYSERTVTKEKNKVIAKKEDDDEEEAWSAKNALMDRSNIFG